VETLGKERYLQENGGGERGFPRGLRGEGDAVDMVVDLVEVEEADIEGYMLDDTNIRIWS
jgi:hypothetical protein